jgi:hypothetical protein
MWLSVAAFGIGGVTVFAGGLKALDTRSSAVQKKNAGSSTGKTAAPSSPKR